MFIHELTRAECDDLLAHAKFGRLGCAHANQPYVVPLNFAFDGGEYLYGFTTLGQKVEWVRSNPLVCFEVDEVKNHNHWSSVIVFGRYEELPDTPEFEAARIRAHKFLQKRAMWWEPAYISQEHRDSPHSLTPIFFRIRIENVTGHRANSDASEMAVVASLAGLVPEPQAETHGPKSEWRRIIKAALDCFVIKSFAKVQQLVYVCFGRKMVQARYTPNNKAQTNPKANTAQPQRSQPAGCKLTQAPPVH